VVYVHGGAWAIGDKSRVWYKPELFVAELGYILASINYRLSPYPPTPVVPGRVMFPDHPHDVGEAIAWLYRNVAAYGGDPAKIALVGHSAGAHLVSLMGTDPSYLNDYEVPAGTIRGVVSLDGGAYDIPRYLAQGAGPQGYLVYWNAFGNPIEEQQEPRWAVASPVTHAGSEDPPFMLVTQEADPERIGQARAFAEALGQDPDSIVHTYPKTHEQINQDLGSPEDATTYTEDVRAFVMTLLA
jgi:acetyl esterase/lipase